MLDEKCWDWQRERERLMVLVATESLRVCLCRDMPLCVHAGKAADVSDHSFTTTSHWIAANLLPDGLMGVSIAYWPATPTAFRNRGKERRALRWL